MAPDVFDTSSDATNTGDGFVTFCGIPVPAFVKAFAPDVIAQGETSTFTFTIDNSASAMAATTLQRRLRSSQRELHGDGSRDQQYAG